MRVSVNVQDQIIVVDGEALGFPFQYFPPGLRAIQWDGVRGSMEFDTGANQFIDNPALVQPYVDQFNAEAARLAAEAAAGGV